MLDLFENIEEVKQEESIQEDKQEATADASEVAQSEDDDIDKMIEEQEEYDELAYMVSFKYGLTLHENIKDENLEKIKHLVYDSHYMDFEEEKHQIESLIMDATDASEQEEVKQEAIDFNIEKEETIQEVKQEESIQEDKQEATATAEANAIAQVAQEVARQRLQEIADAITVDVYQEIIDISSEKIEFKILDKNSTQEVVKQEETIQESEQEDKEKQSSFKDYLKTIIPIQDFATQEFDDSIIFNFTIKKADLIGFKAPKVYSSYEHSLKIKKGQEEAKKRGKKPGLKPGMKRERADKQPLIEQIKKLSNSFNGAMNNHELSKLLNCSLNRICAYKREIKQQLKNRD